MTETRTESTGVRLLREWVEKITAIREAEQRIKDDKREAAELESKCLEWMEMEEMQNVKLADGHLAYVNRQHVLNLDRSGADDDEDGRNPAEDSELKDRLVREVKKLAKKDPAFLGIAKEVVDLRTLMKHVREALPADDLGVPTLPRPLVGIVKVVEVVKLGLRKG